MKKRLLASVMSLCMILSLLPVSAFAEKPGGTPESEPTCICETKCAEGSPNAECSVCGAKGADLTQCMGVEEITEPDCTCEIKCAEGSLDENCPVCGAEGADLTQCAGTEAITEPVCTCETKCAEGSPNAECLVCGGESADLTQCVGVEEITEPDCTCEIRCSEGSLNEDCPVCGGEGANPAQCKGQPQAEPNLLTEEEDSATEYAMCSYESADHTVKSKDNVTLSEAVEALNEQGGGTITVTSSGTVDCDNLVTSNITILPAKGSDSIKLTLAEVKDRDTSAMFRVENDYTLTFGEAGLTEDSLIFSGGNLKDSCIVSVTAGYSTARLVIYDGVLITECLGSAIGKHYGGSGVFSRSPHVEMYGGKVAYNGTAENRSHDSCIKARSFTMTGGEISYNYGGTAGAVEINDGVRINDNVYCDISGNAVIKNCHGSTVGAILGAGSYTKLSGNVKILNCIGGETGGVSCGSEATFSGNVLIEGCKGDAVGGIYATDPITLSDHVTIRDCGLIPVDPDDSVREYKENAGGIYAWDTLTIKDHVTIENCTGNRGGAICLRYVFSVNPLGSSIGGNTVIRNNSAPYGGAIYVESRELEIEDNAQIINNTAENAGGGVYIAPLEKDRWSSYLDSLLIVSGGDIQGNQAPLGGGIYVSGTEEEGKRGYKPGKLALSGGSVTNNTAEEAGGGIYQCYDATVFVSGNPQVTGNTCDGTVNNLQLGWNGVDKPEDPEVTLEEFSAAFKQGEETFTAIIMEVALPPYVQEFESFFDSADPKDLAETALQIGLTDFVINDGKGNQVYVGTKDAFVDACINFLSSILEPQILDLYNSLKNLDQEQQEKALELYYHSLFSPGAEQYQIAHIAITAPLNGASIGITAENDSVGRLVAEGDIYETFSGLRDDESESKKPYQIIDQDVPAFSSDDPQYYISFASDNENQLVLNKNFKLTYEVNGGTAMGPGYYPSGAVVSLKDVTPVYDGYTFVGWYSDETLTAQITEVTMNADQTIYAKWEKITGDEKPGGDTPSGEQDPPDSDGQGGGSGGGSDRGDSDPTGNLSIELDVNGGGDEFTFTVILTDKDGDDLENNFYYNGDYTGTIGSGDEITLEGGDKIVIRNLPEGTRYEVIIETADGYTYVIDGEEGVIHTGMNEAEFTATRTVPVADPSVTGVSRWLNTTDHIAYLTGYPGGAFGPDNNMTRAEVAQMFYALLNNKNVTITKTFPDVPADAWYATAVNTLASLGMVSGDENGNYRPDAPITRAEFCVIALAFAYEPENAVCYFGDVSRSDWFYTYVAQAASYGWIGGYTNGNFGPNDRITRAQVTTIVNNMLGRAADRDYVIDHQAALVQFTDLTRAHWGYFQIMEATNAHDYTKSNGTENWR